MATGRLALLCLVFKYVTRKKLLNIMMKPQNHAKVVPLIARDVSSITIVQSARLANRNTTVFAWIMS